MKTKFYLVLVLVSIGLTSCKNNDEKVDKTEDPKANSKENFSVDLEVVAPKADNFAIYYTEDGTINFTGDKAVWRGVVAEPTKPQIVTIDFPVSVLPTHIRFDLGNNNQQDDIVLNSFKLSFYEKSFQAKGSDFFKYFIPNDSIKTEIDPAKGTIKFLKNPKSFFVPFYYPQQAVLDEVKKITK